MRLARYGMDDAVSTLAVDKGNLEVGQRLSHTVLRVDPRQWSQSLFKAQGKAQGSLGKAALGGGTKNRHLVPHQIFSSTTLRLDERIYHITNSVGLGPPKENQQAQPEAKTLCHYLYLSFL